MSLDRAAVQHIALLARIRISDTEADALVGDLSKILAWVEQLGEVDTSGVEPMASVVARHLPRRADVVADIANDISMGMLGTGSTLKSRYDDFVWAHHQVMMLGPNDPSGPNLAHRGPAFIVLKPAARDLDRLLP